MAKKTTAKRSVDARGSKKEKGRPAKDRVASALAAALKDHRGEKLTQAERRDLAWWQKSQRESITDEAYRSIPKGVYCSMSGRQQKVIDDQAERYDLPIDGAEINLFDAIKSYHDLITANSRQIRAADDAEAIASGEVGEMNYAQLQIIKLQEEITKLQRGNESLSIRVTRERGDTINRNELRDLLRWLSTRLEGLGQQLRNSAGGEEAQKSLNEFLDHLADECKDGVLRV